MEDHILRLSNSMTELLRDVIAKRGLNSMTLRESDGIWFFSPADREILLEGISAEFSESGLSSDDEPNERGFQLEELLDRINNVRGL